MTAAPADANEWVVINAESEPVQDNPWTEFSGQFGYLARSEPPAVAEASGSSAYTTEQNTQILDDFKVACQLQAELDREVTGNDITSESARKPEAPSTNRQMKRDNPSAKLAPRRPVDPHDTFHPGFWSTARNYKNEV